MIIESPLLTDLYQLTMAYGYWKLGMADRLAVFQLFFRKNPFHGHFTISCGLADVIDYLQNYHFKPDELNYLSSLKTTHDLPLFDKNFIEYLSQLRFQCDVDAIPEANLVFPNEPLLRVTGPLLQCQLIETPLINIMNYSSLIATKAARIVHLTPGDTVIEFGLRRAHGPNGGLMASRAAYIGGCSATSNTLASKIYGIPVKGTVAHSWIMAFANELEAFHAFAKIMPHNSILLVDTYDTQQGIQNAITIGQQLRAQGQDLQGIRLDSGDLYILSCKARQMLDEAGFTKTKIVASGDLDEKIIALLKQQKAPIDVWGVGTKLTTAYQQPSLDMAYKLTAIQNEQQQWQYKIKRSDAPVKTTTPGIQQVRRYYRQQQMLADHIYDIPSGIHTRPPQKAEYYTDLLIPIFKKGTLDYVSPDIPQLRDQCLSEVTQFYQTHSKRYPVIIDKQLQHEKKLLLTR